jgi:hypothetical protein
MALSNWDLLAFDTEPSPISGNFKFKNGVRIEIYKNFIYVSQDGEDVVDGEKKERPAMSIQHGELSFNGVSIDAVRHEGQNSIFVYATCTHYDKSEDGESTEYSQERFCSIGCYGFMSRLDWIKKNQPELLKDVPKQFLENPDVHISEGSDFGPEGTCDHIEFSIWEHPDNWALDSYEPKEKYYLKLEEMEDSLDKLWEGVNEETFSAFKEWMNGFKTDYDKNSNYIDSLTQDNAARVNQGDLYFSKALGIDLNSSKVGEQGPTVLSEIIKNMK